MEVICTEFLTSVKWVIRYGPDAFPLFLISPCTVSFVNLNIKVYSFAILKILIESSNCQRKKKLGI